MKYNPQYSGTASIEKFELLTASDACANRSMEYCSPVEAGTTVSHLSLLDSVECKALKIIGTSCDEAEAQCLLLPHHRQVGDLFFSAFLPV